MSQCLVEIASKPSADHRSLMRESSRFGKHVGSCPSRRSWIETYAANGFGIGLSVAVPKTRISPRLRVLKLDDFVPVVVGALWQAKLTSLTEAFLEELQRRAQQLLAEPRGPKAE